MHIHFPDYNYFKGGISSSLAVFISIFCVLRNIKLKYSYVITGEIDIEGNLYEVGDIEKKIILFKKSGCNFFISSDKNKELYKGSDNMHSFSSVKEVIEFVIDKENYEI